jgi:hypothetical protein
MGHRSTFPAPTENERMEFGQKLLQAKDPEPDTGDRRALRKKQNLKPGYTDTLYSFVSMARLLILSRPFSRYLSVFSHKTIGRWDCFVMKFKEIGSRQTGTRTSALPSFANEGRRRITAVEANL